MKKVLIVSTIIEFIVSFERNDISILQGLGYEVHVACNSCYEGSKEKEKVLKEMGVLVHLIPFERSPFSKRNVTAYNELKTIMNNEQFDIVHCHTPVGGVLGRISAHNCHVPCIIYTAHGFHFYKGAPLKNWFFYYPIEWILSRFTDIIITINSEDYRIARKRFGAKKIVYIPGVGVDAARFANCIVDKNKKRNEIGIPIDAKLLISVGELSHRKNHKIVIEALQELPSDYWYVIAGEGYLRNELMNMDKTGRLKLLGFRTDIPELLKASNMFVFPSLQEGLPVSLMEAMAAGVPCTASRIRGNSDLLDATHLVDCYDSKAWVKAIEAHMEYDQNLQTKHDLLPEYFNVDSIKKKMIKLYQSI